MGLSLQISSRLLRKCYEFEKVGKTNIKLLDLTDKKYDESILELINNVL